MDGFLVCASCGQTFAEFQKSGLLGCSACYLAFESELGRILKRLHGARHHCVEAPPKQDALAVLEAQLQDAVRREAYEEAVALRDHIRILKQGLNDHDV